MDMSGAPAVAVSPACRLRLVTNDAVHRRDQRELGDLSVNQAYGGLGLPHLGFGHRDLLLCWAGLQFVQRCLRGGHIRCDHLVLRLCTVELSFEHERIGAHGPQGIEILLSALQLGLGLHQRCLGCLQLEVPRALDVSLLLGVDAVLQFRLCQVCPCHLDVLFGQAHPGTSSVNLSVE
jgi:hypothetical protein